VDRSGIDGGRKRVKARRVNDEERGRVGRLLKDRREHQDLSQYAIAVKTKLSVGTIQAIEYFKYRVHIENIETYANALGTTIQELLYPPTSVPASDPLLIDLNREHLAIARGYMRAVKIVRAAVETLLAAHPERAEVLEEIADVVIALAAAADQQPQLAYGVSQVLERGDLLANLADRLDRDALFEERLRELLNEPPPKTTTATTENTSPKRKPKI